MRELDADQVFWAATVDQATRGNVDAARDVLVSFAETVEQIRMFHEPEKHWAGPIPWVGADFLATAFRKILNGEDHAKALRLKAEKRGRRKGKTVFHDQEAVAAAYFFLLRQGFEPEQVNEELKKELGIDRATIYRARTAFSIFGKPKRFSQGRLKTSLEPYASNVSAILKRRIK